MRGIFLGLRAENEMRENMGILLPVWWREMRCRVRAGVQGERASSFKLQAIKFMGLGGTCYN